MVRILFTAELAGIVVGVRSFSSAVVSCDLIEPFVLTVPNARALVALLLVGTVVFVFGSFLFIRIVIFAGDFACATIRDVNQDAADESSKNRVFFMVVFVCVLFSNINGILADSFTITGSMAAPSFISLMVFFAYAYTIISRYGLRALAGFIPAGTHPAIVPLIVFIEVVSTFAKFASLAIRLFANMFAGHLLLKVFYCICYQAFAYSMVALALPIDGAAMYVFLAVIVLLELMIAVLQAFVMLLLCAIYLKEADNFVMAH
jgi:F-type H+-transporting ATPase subunit a